MTDPAPTSPRQLLSAALSEAIEHVRERQSKGWPVWASAITTLCDFAEAYRSASLPVTPEQIEALQTISKMRGPNDILGDAVNTAKTTLARVASLPVQQARPPSECEGCRKGLPIVHGYLHTGNPDNPLFPMLVCTAAASSIPPASSPQPKGT